MEALVAELSAPSPPKSLLIKAGCGSGKTQSIRQVVAQRPGALAIMSSRSHCSIPGACTYRTLPANLDTFSLLLLDEVHRIPRAAFGIIASSSVPRVGFTATPNRKCRSLFTEERAISAPMRLPKTLLLIDRQHMLPGPKDATGKRTPIWKQHAREVSPMHMLSATLANFAARYTGTPAQGSFTRYGNLPLHICLVATPIRSVIQKLSNLWGVPSLLEAADPRTSTDREHLSHLDLDDIADRCTTEARFDDLEDVLLRLARPGLLHECCKKIEGRHLPDRCVLIHSTWCSTELYLGQLLGRLDRTQHAIAEELHSHDKTLFLRLGGFEDTSVGKLAVEEAVWGTQVERLKSMHHGVVAETVPSAMEGDIHEMFWRDVLHTPLPRSKRRMRLWGSIFGVLPPSVVRMEGSKKTKPIPSRGRLKRKRRPPFEGSVYVGDVIHTTCFGLDVYTDYVSLVRTLLDSAASIKSLRVRTILSTESPPKGSARLGNALFPIAQVWSAAILVLGGGAACSNAGMRRDCGHAACSQAVSGVIKGLEVFFEDSLPTPSQMCRLETLFCAVTALAHSSADSVVAPDGEIVARNDLLPRKETTHFGFEAAIALKGGGVHYKFSLDAPDPSPPSLTLRTSADAVLAKCPPAFCYRFVQAAGQALYCVHEETVLLWGTEHGILDWDGPLQDDPSGYMVHVVGGVLVAASPDVDGQPGMCARRAEKELAVFRQLTPHAITRRVCLRSMPAFARRPVAGTRIYAVTNAPISLFKAARRGLHVFLAAPPGLFRQLPPLRILPEGMQVDIRLDGPFPRPKQVAAALYERLDAPPPPN